MFNFVLYWIIKTRVIEILLYVTEVFFVTFTKTIFLTFTAIRSGDYYMFDEFDDELDSIVEKDNELSDDSLEDDDSDKTDSEKMDHQVNTLYTIWVWLVNGKIILRLIPYNICSLYINFYIQKKKEIDKSIVGETSKSAM